MPDTAIVSVLTSAGVAGIFCLLFSAGLVFPRSVIADLKAEIAELKGALDAERDRANTLAAVQFGRDLNQGHGP